MLTVKLLIGYIVEKCKFKNLMMNKFSANMGKVLQVISGVPKTQCRFLVSASSSGRKRLVILGTGWGSYSVLKQIDKKQYDVLVVSPRNHFLFTPLLCSTTVGTLEFRYVWSV